MQNEFRLPSQDKMITFREVTVQDALDLAQLNPKFEEKSTSWWLTNLQDGDVYPAKQWSQEDRIVGLLYLYFLTQDDVQRRVSYTCQHCGESHTFSADYGALAKNPLNQFDVWPTAQLQDEYQLNPLTGEDLEELEMLKLQDPAPTDDQLRLQVIAKRLRTDPAQLAKLSLTKYISLMKEAESKLEEIRHGIDLTVSHICPAEGLDSQIALPFRANDFIPRV